MTLKVQICTHVSKNGIIRRRNSILPGVPFYTAIAFDGWVLGDLNRFDGFGFWLTDGNYREIFFERI